LVASPLITANAMIAGKPKDKMAMPSMPAAELGA
jgi:hypothetical protein